MRVIDEFSPRRILAVHSPLHCVNFDGPAEDVSRRMAEASAYPLRPSLGYPTPGSLGSYMGVDRRIPTVTLELRRYRSEAAAWTELKEALLAFLR